MKADFVESLRFGQIKRPQVSMRVGGRRFHLHINHSDPGITKRRTLRGYTHVHAYRHILRTYRVAVVHYRSISTTFDAYETHTCRCEN